MKNEKIFISGPVSEIIESRGYLAAVLDFENAEARLNAKYPEATIVNPMKLCRAEWGWLRCMVKCLWNLYKCDSIALMQGWQNSRGSRIERCFAVRWRMKIIRIFKTAIIEIKTEEF